MPKIYPRIPSFTRNSSFFLFGPRGTGKTTLIKNLFSSENSIYINLLEYEVEKMLLQSPDKLREIVLEAVKNTDSKIDHIVIDEIQKIPRLLNEVHNLIEMKLGVDFILTGSSARKIRRGGANLLAGRAFSFELFPLLKEELGDDFNISDYLQYGGLPRRFQLKDQDDVIEFLTSYTETYLQEEIVAEATVRNLDSFRNFLSLAATNNGEFVSFSNFANDTGVSRHTIKSYFEILEDTLIAYKLPAFKRSIRKKERTAPKYYFFDLGITNVLKNTLTTPIKPGTSQFGRAFEHFIINKIIAHNSYKRVHYRFSYWATSSSEIDLVAEKPGGELVFIEIKSTNNVKNKHLSTLKRVVESVKDSKGLCISLEKFSRQVSDNIKVCGLNDFIKNIFP